MDKMNTISICALFISTMSLLLTNWTAFLHRKHMRLSVKPIASFPVADFENCVGVFLKNKGLDPMLIISFCVLNSEGKSYASLQSHMPALNSGILWSNFHDNIDGATLEAGKKLDLILLQGDVDNQDYRVSRDRVRRKLAELIIKIEYEDLYGQRMDPHAIELSFFGRHFDNS